MPKSAKEQMEEFEVKWAAEAAEQMQRAEQEGQRRQQAEARKAQERARLYEEQEQREFNIRKESLIQSVIESVASGNITCLAVDMMIDAALTEAGLVVDKLNPEAVQADKEHTASTCRIHMERIMQTGIKSAALAGAFTAILTRNPMAIATEASKAGLGGMVGEAVMEKIRMDDCKQVSRANKPR